MTKGFALMLSVIGLLAAGMTASAHAAVGGGGGTFTSTTSTFDHNYDLYYGSVTVTEQGQPAPLSSSNAFSLELRVDQAAAEFIAAGLGNHPAVTGGLAGQAPDGGSWITAAARPDWWRFPDGSATESQPAFPNAQALFEAQLAQVPAGASCTDSTADTLLRSDEDLYAFFTTTTFGPDDILIGEQRTVPFNVAPGTTNVNTEISSPVIDAHRRDRTCVVPRLAGEAAGVAGAAPCKAKKKKKKKKRSAVTAKKKKKKKGCGKKKKKKKR